MQNKLHLKSSSMPKMMGSLMHSNQFLKIFSLTALCLSIVLGLGLMFSLNKEPLVITLTPDGNILAKVDYPKPVDEIKVATRAYINLRYNWEPTDVVKKLKASEAFLLAQSLKAFQGAVFHVAKFSTDKQVAQKAYVNQIEVNLAQKTISVRGDRVTSIQGLKAAGNLKLQLSFENGPRTEQNPWGIYMTMEKEE